MANLASFQDAIRGTGPTGLRLLLQRLAFDSAIMTAVDFPRDESLSTRFQRAV